MAKRLKYLQTGKQIFNTNNNVKNRSVVMSFKVYKRKEYYRRFQVTFRCNIPSFVAKFAAKFKSLFRNS